MKCERAIELLTESRDRVDAAERRFADEHLNHCVDCRDAIVAIRVLNSERTAVLPLPPEGALERALAAATARSKPAAPARRPFWLGMSVGAALAAGVAIAVVSLAPRPAPFETTATPRIEMALNEPRDVSISLATAEPLADAEIHVVLSGAIALNGFDGRKELRWRTSLERGSNQLTLPIVALAAEGGQVLVEVTQAHKRRTFVVDIHGLA